MARSKKEPAKKKTRKKAKQKSRKQQAPGKIRLVFRWAGYVATGLVILSFAFVLPFRWVNPTTSAFMLADDSGRVPVMHEWVAWEEIGTAAPLAVVAAEDQRFAEHFGLDLKAIQKAVEESEDGGGLRGASTITQQTVKNMYLWSGRSFVRKGLEAWLTIVMEISLPKQRILEIYLNIVELGPGIYGVGAASEYFFGKTPANLSDSQAALLAAVLPNPIRFQVDHPSDYVRERQQWILGHLRRMRREGWLTLIN